MFSLRTSNLVYGGAEGEQQAASKFTKLAAVATARRIRGLWLSRRCPLHGEEHEEVHSVSCVCDRGQGPPLWMLYLLGIS